MKKVAVTATVQVRAYDVLCRAVEEGIGYGWNRAHKHVDKPTPEAIRSAIEDAVMNALSEVLSFHEEN